MSDALDCLVSVLDGIGDVAIAVSGGVDSITLAHVAHARSVARAEMFHAVSPAVPDHATDRVREHAAAHGWSLHVVGAGEFEDPDYLKNPVNRCYFCKSNLYARLRASTDATLCSGTNTDDLGDFRPGLRAADEKTVRHPFVEAGLTRLASGPLPPGSDWTTSRTCRRSPVWPAGSRRDCRSWQSSLR